MIVIYVLLGALALVTLIRIGYRPHTPTRSIDRYHRAMEALGGIGGQAEPSSVTTAPAQRPRVAQPAVLEPAEPVERGDAATGNPADATSRISAEAQSSQPVLVDEEILVARFATARAEPSSSQPAIRQAAHHLRSHHAYRFALVGMLIAAVATTGGLELGESRAPNAVRIAASRARPDRSPRPTVPHRVPARVPTVTPRAITATTASRPKAIGPVLSSLTPDAGVAGQTVTLTGSGFTSANGTIVAMFDSRPMPTRCPSEQRCLVTVLPVLPGSVLVRLQTESASSNTLIFHNR